MDKKFIPYGKQWITKKERNVVDQVLASDWITQGPKVKEFEEKLAKYAQAKYAVAVSSGTAALHIACLAAGLKKGDEAITSPITFLASANAIVYTGAKPVFCDIEKHTKCIDPSLLEKKITSQTKVIIPVDFAGHPVQITAINKLAKKHNLIVIEDSAHALGAEYHGKKIGSLSDMTIFSFHPVKHITTGEGGAVLTNNKRLYENLCKLRNHGIERAKKRMSSSYEGDWYYEMQELGFNYRITDFQCALGIEQLKRLDDFVAKRRMLAQYYTQLLGHHHNILLPYENDDVKSSYHLYPVNVKDAKARKMIFDFLRKQNIGVQVHYIPVHLQPYYQKKFALKRGDFPIAENYYDTTISLPLFAQMTKKDVRRVVNTLERVL